LGVAASASELSKVKQVLIRAQADLEHASTGVDPLRIRLEATMESMEAERTRLKSDLAESLASRDKARVTVQVSFLGDAKSSRWVRLRALAR
jgi:ribosome-binding factor A